MSKMDTPQTKKIKLEIYKLRKKSKDDVTKIKSLQNKIRLLECKQAKTKGRLETQKNKVLNQPIYWVESTDSDESMSPPETVYKIMFEEDDCVATQEGTECSRWMQKPKDSKLESESNVDPLGHRNTAT